VVVNRLAGMALGARPVESFGAGISSGFREIVVG